MRIGLALVIQCPANPSSYTMNVSWMHGMRSMRLPKWAVPCALAVVAVAAFWISTPYGIGLGFDSIWYIAVARNLLADSGLGRYTCVGFKPLTLWPPLYPIVLAWFSRLGMDPTLASRFVGAIGYGSTVFLGGLVAGKATASRSAAAMTSALLLLSAPLLQVSTWAMSEHLFLPLTLSSFLLLGLSIKSSSRSVLFAAGIFAGAGALTRYVGATTVLAGTITLVLALRRTGRRRWLDALLFTVCGLLPLALWFAFNALTVGSATNRRLDFHPPTAEDLTLTAKTVAGWFLPDRLNVVPLQGLAVATVAVIVFLALACNVIRARSEPNRLEPWTLNVSLFAILYPLVIFTSATFLTPGILEPLGDRLLIPLHTALLILVCVLHTVLGSQVKGAGRTIAIVVSLLLLLVYGVRYPGLLRNTRSDGQGFASVHLRDSETSQALRSLQRQVIYTNDIQAMYFLADKPSCAIPTSSDGLREMRSNLGAKQGVVVIFGRLTGEFLPFEEVTLGLDVLDTLPQAVVYGYPP
jgi:4-amino-4-deoxy-L-arabinose transferase-like glycosyltransferase